jgi:hypothetical protein
MSTPFATWARARRLHDAAVRAYDDARARARTDRTRAALDELARAADRRLDAEVELASAETALRYAPRAA